MSAKQDFVYLSAKMPTSGKFELLHFSGVEQVSSCFEFTLTLSSDNNTVNFNDVMGKSVTITIDAQSKKRYFNGIIGRFEQMASPPTQDKERPPSVYVAHVYPKLWTAQFSSNCRIFQNHSALDIVKNVLQENNIAIQNNVSSHGTKKREFCVQYNESDFDFVSRLMEEEGIFYFFSHENGKHTMVLGDSSSANSPCANASEAHIVRSKVHAPFMMGISTVQISQNIVPSESTWVNYNFKSPKNLIKVQSKGHSNAHGGNVYHYPGPFTDHSGGESWSKTYMESLEAFQNTILAESTIPFFEAGASFNLKGHTRGDINTQYVLYRVEHDARASEDVPIAHTFNTRLENPFWGGANKEGTLYVNRFTAYPKKNNFRPPRCTPKPVIHGTQTAIVTGKSSEEIYTEEYGRIKVKFHWDIHGKDHENSSCWIRVSTPWAGKGWGVSMVPRIGQEVVVAFLNGNPDDPIVVGSVYNGEHKPPYLPSHPAKSTIKTHSTKNGGSNHNEITFDDTMRKEQLYVHAQKDMVVEIENDETRTLTGGSRTTSLKAKFEKGEETAHKKANDKLTLERGDHSVKLVWGNHSYSIDKGNYSTKILKGNESLDIDKGNSSTKLLDGNISRSIIKGNESLSIDKGNYSVSILDGNQSVSIKKGNYSISIVDGGVSVTVDKGDISFTAAAGNINFKCTESFSIDAGASVNIKAGADSAIDVGGAYDMNAAGDATLVAGGAYDVTSGGDYTLTVGGAAEVTAGGDVAITAGGAVEVTAGGDSAVTAGGATEVTAGGDTAVTAAGATEITAAGTTTTTSATLENTAALQTDI